LVCSWEKYFLVVKNTLQLFFSFSTIFYSQDVVENIVAKGGGFLLVINKVGCFYTWFILINLFLIHYVPHLVMFESNLVYFYHNIKIQSSTKMKIVNHSSLIELIEIFCSQDGMLLLEENRMMNLDFVFSSIGFVFWGFISLSAFVEIMFEFNSCGFPSQIVVCSFCSLMT